MYHEVFFNIESTNSPTKIVSPKLPFWGYLENMGIFGARIPQTDCTIFRCTQENICRLHSQFIDIFSVSTECRNNLQKLLQFQYYYIPSVLSKKYLIFSKLKATHCRRWAEALDWVTEVLENRSHPQGCRWLPHPRAAWEANWCRLTS